MVDLQELNDSLIDLVIRWGNGRWDDGKVKCLFLCPAFATGARGINQKIEKEGLANQTLLRDWKHSTAWQEWHTAGNFAFEQRRDSLIIPDPNVRVQAVIDGQGIGINDRLTRPELESGLLERINDHALEDYGYFLVQMPGSELSPAAVAFTDWLIAESETENP